MLDSVVNVSPMPAPEPEGVSRKRRITFPLPAPVERINIDAVVSPTTAGAMENGNEALRKHKACTVAPLYSAALSIDSSVPWVKEPVALVKLFEVTTALVLL